MYFVWSLKYDSKESWVLVCGKKANRGLYLLLNNALSV